MRVGAAFLGWFWRNEFIFSQPLGEQISYMRLYVSKGQIKPTRTAERAMDRAGPLSSFSILFSVIFSSSSENLLKYYFTEGGYNLGRAPFSSGGDVPPPTNPPHTPTQTKNPPRGGGPPPRGAPPEPWTFWPPPKASRVSCGPRKIIKKFHSVWTPFGIDFL